MNASLLLIRAAIAAAREQLIHLKESDPDGMESLPEVDELDMGLEWSLKRAERIQAQLDTREQMPRQCKPHSEATIT